MPLQPFTIVGTQMNERATFIDTVEANAAVDAAKMAPDDVNIIAIFEGSLQPLVYANTIGGRLLHETPADEDEDIETDEADEADDQSLDADLLEPPTDVFVRVPLQHVAFLAAQLRSVNAAAAAAEMVNFADDYSEENNPQRVKCIHAARRVHMSGDIQIDSDAALSETDHGVWVSSWVYVSNSDLDDEADEEADEDDDDT